MKKIIAALWLPIVAMIMVVSIYGGLTIAELRIKNQNLEQNKNELETKIVQLENNSNNGNIQVAGIKEEKKPITKITQIEQLPDDANPTPTLTPKPSRTPTPTPPVVSLPSPTPTPTPTPASTATVAIESVGTYLVDLKGDDTAFSILLRAAEENGFSVSSETYEGMGAFVNCIAGICAHDNYYWAFYYNNAYSMVGASAQPILDGDTTAWKFESF